MPAETDFFQAAVRHWWKAKGSVTIKKSQGGTRDANLAGDTMDGFAATIRDFLTGMGVKPEHIFSGGHLTKTPSILPSYFRPSKNWDIVVIGNSRFHPAKGDAGPTTLYAAVEFKSQDKSIGNNQNNRLEESLGNALDFWRTYEQSGFVRLQPRPWLGYLFIGNYQPEADAQPVRVKQPHFLAMQPFRGVGNDENETFSGPSYASRYTMFLQQSIGARLYDAGAFIVSDDGIMNKRPNHRILMPEFGAANFLRSLKGHILAHYPGAAVKPGTLAAAL